MFISLKLFTVICSASLGLTLAHLSPSLKKMADSLKTDAPATNSQIAKVENKVSEKKKVEEIPPYFVRNNRATDIAFEPKATFPPGYFPYDKGIIELGDSYNKLRDKHGLLLDGKLRGKGKAIVVIAKKYGLKPALLAAICVHESARGKSAMANSHNNVTGSLREVKGVWGPRYYNSIEDCLEATARNLKLNYIDQGLTTLKGIQGKYCPVFASPKSKGFNDPKGLNVHWLTGVGKFREMFLNCNVPQITLAVK